MKKGPGNPISVMSAQKAAARGTSRHDAALQQRRDRPAPETTVAGNRGRRWALPGWVRQTAVTMTGRPRPRRDAQGGPGTGAAQTSPAAEIEVTFTPAEPELTPAAARAVLALLLQARDQSGDAGQRRT